MIWCESLWVVQTNNHLYYTLSHLYLLSVVILSPSHVSFNVACQVSLSFTVSLSLLKLMSIESVTPSTHHILCCPLLLLPSIFHSIRVFLVNQLLIWGGQSIRISASVSVLTINIQGPYPLGLTSLISLLFKGLSRGFSSITVQSINSLALSFL